MVKEKAGIYKITNFKDGKVYIGSSVNVDQRKQAHLYCLRNGTGSPILQQDFINYGADLFTFETLEYCPKEQLRVRENHYIKYYESADKDKGYNVQKSSHRVTYNCVSSSKRQCREMIDLTPEAFEIYRQWGNHRKSEFISQLIIDHHNRENGNPPVVAAQYGYGNSAELQQQIDELRGRIEKLEGGKG